MPDPQTTSDRVHKRVAAMQRERSTWLSHWQDINAVLLPRTGNFLGSTPNNASRRNVNILDNSATAALTTLQAGMHSGMTSPARPWLKIETADTDLMEDKAVSKWCDQVTQQLRTMFSRSNTYRTLHGMYGGIGAYGTSAAVLLPDYKDTIRFTPLSAGEFAIGLDGRGEVNSLGRKFQMTVGDIVERYIKGPGDTMRWANASQTVKNLWDRHDVDTWVPVTHLIQPRAYREARYADAANMPFESVCIEDGAPSSMTLNNSGFPRFPGVVMRWFVDGQDLYGSNCPGMVALGDIQQLQVEQMKKAKGIDYMADPPVQVPFELKGQETDLLPGGVSFVTMTGPHSAIRTAFDVQLNLQHLLLDIQDVRGRVNTAFFADLFLFLSNLNGRGDRTAREVMEIHEEKLLMLGPVVENIEGTLHQMVDIAFDYANQAHLLPPPPPQIEDQPLKVEFIGLLSQAQRAVSMAGVDRIIGATAAMATAMNSMEPWDNIDTDIAISKAGIYLGVDPEILRGRDQIRAIRDQRAKQQQAMQQAAAAESAAKTAKDMAGADMSGNNMLSNVARGFASAMQ